MAKGEQRKSFFSNKFLKSIIAMLVLVGALIVLTLFGLNVYTKHGEAVAVPSVKGLQVEEAAGILKKASLDYEIIDSVFLTDGIPGAIIDQVPEEASNVKRDRVIFLTMQAKSVEMVSIPTLKDFSRRQAVATLNSLGFMNIAINEVASAYRGLVLDISYKGKTLEPTDKLPKGAPVTLTVGAGGEVLIDSLIDIIPEMDFQDSPQRSEEPRIDNSYFE